jgi:uncharacterized protein (TIGR02391 family)
MTNRLLEAVGKVNAVILSSGLARQNVDRAIQTTVSSELADPIGYAELAAFGTTITEPEIVDAARDLFASGHYALSAQETIKVLEKYLQVSTGQRNISGTPLMDQIFGPGNPQLVWSDRSTPSEQDEQKGYHRLFSGLMLGLRNPLTHEIRWIDDAETAIEVIVLVQHLLRKAKLARRP